MDRITAVRASVTIVIPKTDAITKPTRPIAPKPMHAPLHRREASGASSS